MKVERMRARGATVRIEGDDIEDARVIASGIAEAEGAHLVEDSLDLSTCEGAGTIGLELLGEQGPELDVLLIALGGGALASGVGHVAKSLAPDVEVIAVQPEGAPAMALSWRSGRVVETESIETIADGVAGRFPIPEVLEDLLVVVDDVALVSEASIKAGMRLLYRHAGLVAEPSAALGVATAIEDPERFAGRRVATIVCGSNVASSDFERWVLDISL
jgi:threonine dehydratase